MGLINKFSGKYSFLSNFYESPVEYNGIKYLSNEAAFQHAKIKDMDKQEQIQAIKSLRGGLREKIVNLVNADVDNPLAELFSLVDPSTAKRLGRSLPMRDTWEVEKYIVMEEIVRNKFTQNESLGKKLLKTGDAVLVEGNYWHDNTWGVCECSKCAGTVGSNGNNNNLGTILMKVRDELKK